MLAWDTRAACRSPEGAQGTIWGAKVAPGVALRTLRAQQARTRERLVSRRLSHTHRLVLGGGVGGRRRMVKEGWWTEEGEPAEGVALRPPIARQGVVHTPGHPVPVPTPALLGD